MNVTISHIKATNLGLSAVVMGLVLLASGCCGECGAVFDAAQGGVKMFTDMQNAPGAQELRDAGCSEALVMTPEILKEFIKSMPEDAQKDEGNFDETVVMCTITEGSTGIGCEEAAKVYAKAAKGAPEEFNVTVSRGQNNPVCDGLFNADGERVGDMNEQAREFNNNRANKR
jgi:hypothetical protein